MRFLKSGIVTAIIATTALLEPKGASYAADLKYEIQSGTVSIRFFPSALELFESAGQNVVGLENTVTPALGFQTGFNILPPNSNRGTNFTFSYDFDTRTLNSIAGAIETTGNYVLSNDTTKLPLPAIQRVGNYTIGFDNNTNNFFLKDNLDAQVRTANLPLKFAPLLDDGKLYITTDLTFSKETSDLLMQGGAINTFGFTGGEAIIVASVTQVPEPSIILGIIGVSLGAFAVKKRKKIML
ncbi:hypothetical protein NIES4071_69260 [Calothrix sp. NIES-4071]|nr:hypothetical protein NIES4071_69260 [Calothrix sp. NIES-4071]BAZ61203.1 hypothetical protein NIES4105_69210 [Calothrix sp. NIES-4105]